MTEGKNRMSKALLPVDQMVPGADQAGVDRMLTNALEQAG